MGNSVDFRNLTILAKVISAIKFHFKDQTRKKLPFIYI